MARVQCLATKPRMSSKKFTRVKALEGAPQKKAIVYQMAIVTPRKPNSARRKIAKVRMVTSLKKVFCKMPGMGDHFLKNFSVVMVEGHGPKDTPGVNYTLISGLEDFDKMESFESYNRRSKFGTKTPLDLSHKRFLQKQNERKDKDKLPELE